MSFDFGIPAIRVDNDNTLFPWLHDLFTRQIGELKQYITSALIKPSRIREKYLATLMKHSPTSNDCPTYLMVHAHKGQGYQAKLEQKLTRVRNWQLPHLTRKDFSVYFKHTSSVRTGYRLSKEGSKTPFLESVMDLLLSKRKRSPRNLYRSSGGRSSRCESGFF